MSWSRRTVFDYLERLERAQISSKAGLSSYHGTKRRVLHPEKLLLVPRESCTPTRRESCTGSKSLDSKKMQRGRKKQNHPSDDAARDPFKCEIPAIKPLNPPVQRTAKPPRNAARLARVTAAARRKIRAIHTTESPAAVDTILREVIARADRARTVIYTPSYLVRAFESQLADDAARLGSAELVARAPEMRRNIAFVHEIVEQAAREGRPAREVLERLPP